MLLLGVLAMCSVSSPVWASGSENFGNAPLREGPYLDWKGIMPVINHPARVYSNEVNGNENFYFKVSPDEINELIRLFSETRMRDHELWIKAGTKYVKSFHGDRFNYNVNLHVLAGIALGHTRRDEKPNTYEPTLTVFVDPSADQAFWKQITLPDNIILSNEVANCPLKGKATKPKRKVWYAQVQFDDSTPAADLEHGLSTKVTLWEKDIKAGIKLDEVSYKGYFHVPFSDKEISDLKTGNSWLTLTVGNWATEARRDHPKLSIDKLALDKAIVRPVRINKPGFFHGRILFEDGSPPILDPVPWPGAEIMVDFPYAGSARIDSEGYFKVYFTMEQYEKVKAEKIRKNIYIPSYEEKGIGTARFAFSASKLSRDKEEAGVLRIPKPGPKSEPMVGKDAPELDAAAWSSGESTSLASLRDETVVLAFWDHTDEACAELVQLLNRLLVEYPEKGVEFLSIHSADADLDALKGFISEKSIKFRVALDKPARQYRGATFEKYGAKSVPAIYIIDTKGKVRYQDIPLAALEEAVKSLLDEQ